MGLMLVEDIHKPKKTENNPFMLCENSKPFPIQTKPFSRDDLKNLWDSISNWGMPEKIDWLCPKCKENIVTTINGKGSCFVCSSHWKVRPALTLV